ncbi:MAG: hypothetical protein ABIJ00_09510, partial [Candidatus Eisenbacteria bacterium]
RGSYLQRLYLVSSSPGSLPPVLNIDSYFLFRMSKAEDLEWVRKQISGLDTDQLKHLHRNECLCFGSLWQESEPVLVRI